MTQIIISKVSRRFSPSHTTRPSPSIPAEYISLIKLYYISVLELFEIRISTTLMGLQTMRNPRFLLNMKWGISRKIFEAHHPISLLDIPVVISDTIQYRQPHGISDYHHIIASDAGKHIHRVHFDPFPYGTISSIRGCGHLEPEIRIDCWEIHHSSYDIKSIVSLVDSTACAKNR
ncbi:hypothetical protein BH10CYA1_BH10CYA1_03470 [soil metagenome]